MTSPPDLSKLSHAEKDTLTLALFAQLAAAHERIAAQDARILALEARLDELTRPPKTPDNPTLFAVYVIFTCTPHNPFAKSVP